MPRTPNRSLPILGLAISGMLLVAVAGIALAQDDADTTTEPTLASFDFEADAQGWVPLFADYREGGEAEVADAVAEWRPLPEGLEGHGLYLQAANRSDDLWMSWYGKVEGLEPSAEYAVDAE